MTKHLNLVKVAGRTFLIIFLLTVIAMAAFALVYGKGAPVEYANKFYFFRPASTLLPISPELYAKAKIIDDLFLYSLLCAFMLNVWYEYEDRKIILS